MTRAEEIRSLNALSVDELIERAKGRLVVVDNVDDLHMRFADSIASTIAANNRANKRTAMIVPYGPTAQYPLLCDIVRREQISLRHTTFFFMDEYADSAGKSVPESHPLSFRGATNSLWSLLDPELRPLEQDVVFPRGSNIDFLPRMIDDAGGAEVCYGGIGIHGHLAFNEPEPGVRDSDPRLVSLNDFTVTINAIRSRVGGDLENFPRRAWTLGMKQCLGARRMELYCRNDIPGLDWANTVLRLAVLGEPGDDYPVTWIREHHSYQVITDRRTAERPDREL